MARFVPLVMVGSMNERNERNERNGRNAGGARLFAVEMLRVLAIAGIAVFHTFLPAFEGMMGRGALPMEAGVPISAVTGSLWAAWLVAMLKFVGAWGNHVFFMISGYFLIPRMMRSSWGRGYWRPQIRATSRRVMSVLVTVAFYTLIMLALDRFVTPVTSAGWMQWFALGLEFIWVYVLLVAFAPVLAWLLARFARWNRRVLACFAALAVLLVYALNAYVGFFCSSHGSFALFDWRKWMGAVSYGVSFALAGLVGCAVREAGSRADASKRVPWWLRRGAWTLVMMVAFVALGASVAWAVSRDDYALLYQMSFKSTSVFSFILAVGSLMFAVCGRPTADSGVGRLVRKLASGILGFYVVQSLAGDVWKPVSERAMAPFLANAAAASPVAHFGWMMSWLAVGVAFSVAFVVVVCVCDRLVRQPLLRAMKLIR